MRVLEWKKPTVTFYHERLDKPETEPFAVIKARKIVVESEDDGFKGNIVDFFALMGDVDQISSFSAKGQRYVLCWFDDAEDDFGNPPIEEIVSENLVGQYIKNVIFYGDNPFFIEMSVEKLSTTYNTKTSVYGRNL